MLCGVDRYPFNAADEDDLYMKIQTRAPRLQSRVLSDLSRVIEIKSNIEYQFLLHRALLAHFLRKVSVSGSRVRMWRVTSSSLVLTGSCWRRERRSRPSSPGATAWRGASRGRCWATGTPWTRRWWRRGTSSSQTLVSTQNRINCEVMRVIDMILINGIQKFPSWPFIKFKIFQYIFWHSLRSDTVIKNDDLLIQYCKETGWQKF